MSLRTAHINDIDTNIADWQKDIELADAISRLSDNPDFNRVVREEYFIQDAARLAHLIGDPNLTVQQRSDVLSMVQGAGHFKRFLSARISAANQAAESIKEAQKLRTALNNLSEEDGAEYDEGKITLNDIIPD